MPVSNRLVALGVLAGLAFARPNLAGASEVPACRFAVIEGEVKAGQPFERPIGNGLEIMLEPIASGWVLRVIPVRGPRGQHDYAELATPPYRSVSPLLIGTNFSFRAQDALAWNPRRFRFAASRMSFAELTSAYNEVMRFSVPVSATGEAARVLALRSAELQLSSLVGRAPEAELTIVDARLEQGTANQAQTAAMVASHLNRSAHEVEQPTNGPATGLGKINWFRFRLRITLQPGFEADKLLPIERSGCF